MAVDHCPVTGDSFRVGQNIHLSLGQVLTDQIHICRQRRERNWFFLASFRIHMMQQFISLFQNQILGFIHAGGKLSISVQD